MLIMNYGFNYVFEILLSYYDSSLYCMMYLHHYVVDIIRSILSLESLTVFSIDIGVCREFICYVILLDL